MRIEKQFDIPIPLQDVEAQWRRVQKARRAQVRLSVVDESHTRVHVSAEDPAELDRVAGELAGTGLSGVAAAGNPAAGGAAPGGAGGTFAGGTGGTPGPGGGKPGTTP